MNARPLLTKAAEAIVPKGYAVTLDDTGVYVTLKSGNKALLEDVLQILEDAQDNEEWMNYTFNATCPASFGECAPLEFPLLKEA